MDCLLLGWLVLLKIDGTQVRLELTAQVTPCGPVLYKANMVVHSNA